MARKLVLACCGTKLYKGEKCRCYHIRVIQRNLRAYSRLLHHIKPVKVGNENLTYKSINAFIQTAKKKNDICNKQREAIVYAIVNNKIPEDYFILSRRWLSLRCAVREFVSKVFPDSDINDISCEQRGGRSNNYDFDFVNKDSKREHIELKFNASDVDETPQFASPMKPSQYLSQSFEEHHFNLFLPKIIESAKGKLTMPDKVTYMKEIHHNKPNCMIPHQALYYEGCKTSSKFTKDLNAIHFYESARAISKKGISAFIEDTELDINKLTSYLQMTQKGKVYMLYKNGIFIKQEVSLDDYKIIRVVKNPSKSRYECETQNGIKLNVLLRWKNGNGIAFPAFQIKARRQVNKWEELNSIQ